MRDWLAQRITAVLMALFTIVLLAQVVLGGLGYGPLLDHISSSP